MGATDGIEGYQSEDVYPSNFHREFTPNWMDAMLRHRGIAPPRRARGSFALMDLGCGDGLALILLAAAYPEGRFVGVDALPAHAEIARSLADRFGLTNVAFRCALFADIDAPAEPAFDYVTAQGVMSWVSAVNQEHVRRIAATHLRPGGVLCVGYNTLPGWKDVLPFQRLVQMLAEGEPGDPVARFAAARERVRALGAAGAPAFSSAFMAWTDQLWDTLPHSYFPHEYLNRHWTPHWSADVMAAMASHGLAYLGSSRADRLRPDFYLREAQRGELNGIADPLAREVAEDILLNCPYRTELYGMGATRIADPAAERLRGWFASTVAPDDAVYSCRTFAGTVRFDNEAARAIVATLAAGPATLEAVHRRGGAGTAADVLNAADALLVSEQILPCDPRVDPPNLSAVNAEIARRAARGDGINAIVSRHGALPLPMARIAAAGAGDKAQRAALKRLGAAGR